MANSEFRGKVTLLMSMGKIPQEVEKLMFSLKKFVFCPETLKKDLEFIDNKIKELSFEDLKVCCPYISSGLCGGDEQLKASAFAGKKPLFQVVQDGTLDFLRMAPGVRKLMVTILTGYGMSSRDANMGVGLRKEDFPDSVKKNLPDFVWNEQIKGFGTFDPHRIMNLLAQVGIRAEDIEGEKAFMPLLKLQYLVTAHGGKTDGVVEWAERVTGKPFDQIGLGDCSSLLQKTKDKDAIKDPLDDVTGSEKLCVEFLGGSKQPGEAKLVQEEMPDVLTALRKLSADSESETITLFGKRVRLERIGSDGVRARFESRAGMPFLVMRSISEMTMLIENEFTSNAKKYDSDIVMKILPKPPGRTGLITRARDLYSKVLSSLLDEPSVNFAHLTTKDLHTTVQNALKAKKSGADIPMVSSGTKMFINAETVELQKKFLEADEETRALVKLPLSSAGRTLKDRNATPPSPNEVRDFIADLVMNKDAWAFDAGSQKSGARLRALAESHGPEMMHLLRADTKLLDTLPENIRESMKNFLTKLAEVAKTKPRDDNSYAQLEVDLKKIVTDAMENLQAKASKLFKARDGGDQELWKKSLAEMTGLDGLDQSTAEGRFTKTILDRYFTRCDPLEQRSMLATFIRNTNENSTDDEQVAEALKGAGPLLQKMLQGLPSNTFGPETQKALEDMKSNLLPIPDSVIKAQLLELVRSSNGEILSVEVLDSIGQATVGQALLCHIRTKNHPVHGEDVVIKILRPNVQTAIQREHKLFMDIAKEIDGTGNGQQTTFEGRYKSILKELDFTFESENIDVGRGAYEMPTVTRTDGSDIKSETYRNVHSMDRHHGVAPMTAMIVLQKVEGRPVDRLMKDVSKRSDEILAKLKPVEAALPGEPTVTTYQAADSQKLMQAKADLGLLRLNLVEQRQGVEKLLDAWLERALFKDGVFHNDLHSGNVMVDKNNVTVIDFGNVVRLTMDERKQLVAMFQAAMLGDSDAFVAALKGLMPENVKVEGDPLKTELAAVFAKGTVKDVLARFLAAMTLLQRQGLPVPGAVYNFAQSLMRIQGVLGAFDDGIAEIERKCAAISIAPKFVSESKDAVKLPNENNDNTDGKSLAIVDALINGLLDLGDPGRSLSFEATKTILETIDRDWTKNEDLRGILKKLDDVSKGGITRKTLLEELQMPANQETSGKKISKPIEETYTKICNDVFTRKDGGVEYLRGVVGRLCQFFQPKVIVKEGALSVVTSCLVGDQHGTAVVAALDEYERALKGEGRSVCGEGPGQGPS